jgi:hypothetical protein
MKTGKLILIAVCAASVIALSGYKKPRKNTFAFGTYGVCDCDNAAPKEAMVELTVNEDYTFHYINNSDPAKKVNVDGKWQWEGERIVLGGYSSAYPINTKWSIDKNNACIKSRLAMNFTRLCKVKPCGTK